MEGMDATADLTKIALFARPVIHSLAVTDPVRVNKIQVRQTDDRRGVQFVCVPITFAEQARGYELRHDIHVHLISYFNGFPEVRRRFRQGNHDMGKIVGCPTLQLGIRKFDLRDRRERRGNETYHGTETTVVLFCMPRCWSQTRALGGLY